jgi:Fe-S cluster assembly ATP-binding protein
MNNTKNILEIEDLNVSIEKKDILKNFHLKINENETHVIMGPNGCGKSTLSKVLAGHPAYEITKGKIHFKNEDLLNMPPEIRSHEGLFLAFQYPIEISGVTNYDFLRIAYNEKQKYLKEKELDPLEFMELIKNLLENLKMKTEFLNRNLNEGFSGGEKKRNEILQMLLLTPNLIILDEIDSGLDIDAIKIICEAIASYKEKKAALLIITHYPKILKYFEPSHVHIMSNGKIMKTGNLELIEMLENQGYESLLNINKDSYPSF